MSETRRRPGKPSKKQDDVDASNSNSAKRKRGTNEIDYAESEEEDGSEHDVPEENDDSQPENQNDEEEENTDEETSKTKSRAKRKTKTSTVSSTKRPAVKKAKTAIPPRKATSKVKPARKKQKTTPGETLPDAEDVGGLYGEVFSGEIEIEIIVTEWRKRFLLHESRALSEIINFVLQCCGCTSKISSDDIEDVDNITTRLADVQNELVKQHLSEYPLIAKNHKVANTMKAKIIEFFDALLKSIDASGELLSYTELIENLQEWLSTLSSAPSRAFRHTASVAALTIMTAVSEVGRNLANAAATAMRQGKNVNKGKSANNKRASGLVQDAQQAQKDQGIVDGILKDWFETIFIHRYRDVDAKIRMECVIALGSWIINYPDFFFDGSHIRYLGWMISDAQVIVRHEALAQLLRLYANKDRLAGLKPFTEKFRPRLIEMATLDSDVGVRTSAIEVLNSLREAAYLEPDDIDTIGRLIFDAEEKVRKAVVKSFVAGVDATYEVKVDGLGGEDALVEEIGDVAVNGEQPGLKWLQLKALVEILDAYNSYDPDISKYGTKGPAGSYRLQAEEVESRFITVAKTLYSSYKALQDWETMANFLLFDTSEEDESDATEDVQKQILKECRLNDNEQFILLELLNASVKVHVTSLADSLSDKKSKKTKKNKEDIINAQENASRVLTQMIPQLLQKFGHSSQTALVALQLERIAGLDALKDVQRDPTSFRNLLEGVEGQFSSHNTETVVTEASRILLQAKSNVDLNEITEDKIEQLWEKTRKEFRSVIVASSSEFSVRDASEKEDREISAQRNMIGILARIEGLAQISNPVASLELSFPEHKSARKAGSREGQLGTPVEILMKLLRRGILNPEEEENRKSARLEDDMCIHTARILSFYTLWTIAELRTTLGQSLMTEEVYEKAAHHRQVLIFSLVDVLKSRRPFDFVAAELSKILLELHVSYTTLRDITTVDTNERRHLEFTTDVPSDIQDLILIVFTACEKRFARKSERKIDQSPDDIESSKSKSSSSSQKTKRTLDDVPIDAEPLSDDELEATMSKQINNDKDDDDETSSTTSSTPSLISDDSSSNESHTDEDLEARAALRISRRETVSKNLALQSTLLAEKSLCELSGKIVLGCIASIFSPTVDGEKKIIKRLLLNRAKLGVNYREICKLLEKNMPDIVEKPGKKGNVKKGKGKETEKSKEIVSEDEDSDDDEAVREEREERELVELEKENEKNADGQVDAEDESVLGD